MPTIGIGIPLALLGLLLVPVIWAATVRTRALLSRRRLRWTLLTRASAVVLVVLALADVRVEWPTDDVAVAVVVDESESIDDAERGTVREQVHALGDADVFEAGSGTGALATQIQYAVGTLPTDHVRRIVVASDGRDPTGDVRASIDAARSAGVRVSMLPLGDDPPMDTASLRGIEVPRLVRAGETLDVGLDIFASTSGRARARVVVGEGDAEAENEVDVDFTPGTSSARVELTFPEEEGTYPIRAVLEGSGGRGENDAWTTMVRVLSRPQVLIVHDAETPTPVLTQVLSDARFRTETVSVADVPITADALDRFGLVVIEEAKLTELSEAQQAAVRSWVEVFGGGLVTITGTNAVRREPELLRDIEPIRRPPAIPEPRPLELVLAIDRSGSMEGHPLAQARAAGVAAVRALREDARVGTVAFSGGADHVMAPVPVEEARDDAADFIGRITSGGGTSIDAALNAANAVISNDDRYIRHVILLSDGHSADGPAIAAAHVLAGRGVSITTITLGSYSPLMAEIARIGRGRYHVTRNPGSLPALFVREAQYRQPPAHRQARLRPHVQTPHRMVRDIDFGSGPPLLGHALSAIKPGADVVLEAPGGYPLLAHWHRGVGQVATFTSATSGGWANEWRGWSGFRTLWSQTAWSMLRTRTVDPVDLRVEPAFRSAERAVITVLGPSLTSAENARAEAPLVHIHRLRETDPRPLELDLVGPGIWQTEVAVDDGLLVTAHLPRDPEPTAAVAFDRPYPTELATFGADRNALERWAEVGGGTVVASVEEAAAEGDRTRVGRSLETPFLILALLLYLAGLALIRLPERRALRSAAPSRSRPAANRRESPESQEAA